MRRKSNERRIFMTFERYLRMGMQNPRSLWRRSGRWGNSASTGAPWKRTNWSGFKYVVLFYDRDKKKIGIKFTNDAKEQGVGKVSMKRRDAMIFAKGFLQHFGIDLPKQNDSQSSTTRKTGCSSWRPNSDRETGNPGAADITGL